MARFKVNGWDELGMNANALHQFSFVNRFAVRQRLAPELVVENGLVGVGGELQGDAKISYETDPKAILRVQTDVELSAPANTASIDVKIPYVLGPFWECTPRFAVNTQGLLYGAMLRGPYMTWTAHRESGWQDSQLARSVASFTFGAPLASAVVDDVSATVGGEIRSGSDGLTGDIALEMATPSTSLTLKTNQDFRSASISLWHAHRQSGFGNLYSKFGLAYGTKLYDRGASGPTGVAANQTVADHHTVSAACEHDLGVACTAKGMFNFTNKELSLSITQRLADPLMQICISSQHDLSNSPHLFTQTNIKQLSYALVFGDF